MDEEQYAALLAKLAELEARIEALSHHGMDHGSSDPLDNGVMFREVKIVPTAKSEVATLYLQDNGATNKLMLQHPTGGAINLTGGSVTNGDSHDHAGGDGAQIDHGGLSGVSSDQHHNAASAGADGEHSFATQVISGVDATTTQKGHASFATADFVVTSGAVSKKTQGASVKHSVAQSLTNGAWTCLSQDTENFDNDTIHDTATNNTRLTCKTAGVYLIAGALSYAANGTGQRHLMLLLNSSTNIAYHVQDANGAGATALVASAIYSLAVNDYVELRALQDSGGNLDCTSINFAMVRLGSV